MKQKHWSQCPPRTVVSKAPEGLDFLRASWDRNRSVGIQKPDILWSAPPLRETRVSTQFPRGMSGVLDPEATGGPTRSVRSAPPPARPLPGRIGDIPGRGVDDPAVEMVCAESAKAPSGSLQYASTAENNISNISNVSSVQRVPHFRVHQARRNSALRLRMWLAPVM
jgi:hypothetical protein